MEVYAWGTGTYGRLGLGHSRDARVPQRVGGVLNGCDVTCTACSWYHSVVVTSTGDVATFGSKVTKCLGTAASGSEEASEASAASDGEASSGEEQRSPAAGSRAGRGSGYRGRLPSGLSLPSSAGDQSRSTANFVPNVLRSFPSRVVVVQVAVGSDMLGAHTLAVTRTGKLYSWGYGPASGLGTTRNVSAPTLVTKFLGTGAGEPGSGRRPAAEMEPLGWGRHSHHRYRQRPSGRHLGLQLLKPRIVKAVCGGGFSAVMSSEGEVFTFGLSASGRLGFRTKFRAQLRPRRIETLSEGTTDLAAGAGFVLLCSAAGRLLSWGDNSKGQLGIGHLQESHEPTAIGRACPAAFVMQAVAAGDSHSLALDSSGRTYSWGGEGGPMTGQGQPLSNPRQVDAAFQFRLRHLHHWWVRPAPVRALIGIRIVHVAAGCLHSLAFSQDGALFAWGALLQAGVAGLAGVSGPEAAWVPRLLAPSPKLPLVRVGSVAAGGWHSLATAMPCCPIEKLLPAYGEDRGVEAFCDGYIVSDPDSRPEEEARVYLCCAAVRARLAMADGSDSPVWRTFSAQVLRLQQDVGVCDSLLEEEDEDEEDTSDASSAGGLMAVVALHRQRPRPAGAEGRGAGFRAQPPVPATPSQVVQCGPGHTSDADEAAGRAVQPTPAIVKPPDEITKKPLPKAPPVFSSDSSGSDSEPLPRSPPQRRGRMMRQQQQPPPGQPQEVAIFSSDSSSSDESPIMRARRPSPPLQQHTPQAATSGRTSFLELNRFSEAVLTALVRFLNTDSLGTLEVIDETHPLWQREQHLRLHSPGHCSDGESDDAPLERPTSLRAAKGLLLMKEVTDLRKVGNALGLERLTCLCDQLMLRLDAPGAPALFVPSSTLRTAMWTLFQQTLEPPLRDGPDTRIKCGPLVPRRPRWGPRTMPGHRKLWAHAFVLYAGCSSVQLEASSETPRQGDGRQSQEQGVEWQGMCTLKRCSFGSVVSFELDLSDVPADVAFAWLRYLYTQDDLTLLWPCSGDTQEDAVAAERFWKELLRLAQRLGDRKLLLYAQDTLVGALSPQNWSQMAIFAEQAQCPVLSEAALMLGVRSVVPALLASFRVPTGLERGEAGKEEPPVGLGEQSATVVAAPGRPAGASVGTVDLELERRLLELRLGPPGAESAAVLTLKKGCPDQFAELKHRLSDTITGAQRTAEQLQRCVQFFDSHERRGFRRDDKHGRALWVELAVLALCLGFFMIPSVARQTVLTFVATVLEPVRASLSYVDFGWLTPFSSGVVRIVAINVFMFFVLCGVIWHNLNK